MSEGSRPVATAEGTLARTPFAHVLLYSAQQRLSGTLAVWPEGSANGESPGAPDRVQLRGGTIVAARTTLEASSLELCLLPLFTRIHASYAFYADQNLVGSGEHVREGMVDPFAIIAASLRGSARDDVVDEVLARVEGSALRMRPTAETARFALQPKEQSLIDLLRAEPATAAELVVASGLSGKTARRLLYLLIVTKMAEPFDPARTTSSRMVSEQVASRLTPAPGQRSGTPRTVKTLTADGQQAGGGAGSTGRPPERVSAPPAPSPSVPAAARASAPPASPTSDQPPAATPSVSPSHPSIPVVSVSAPRAGRRATPSPEVPDAPAELSTEHRALWQEILERARAMENQNYFQMLGIAKESSGTKAREAYFELVKRFHPDRLPQELIALLPQQQLIFRYLTEAHEMLSDDDNRMKYIAVVRDGGGTPTEQKKMSAIVEATFEFQKAEVLLKRRDFDGALARLRSSLTLNPEDADSHALLAWVLFQKHAATDAPIAEMLTAVDIALKLNERSDKAHYYKAMILRRAGSHSEALKHFRRAAELNSNNVEALREVRIATMRGAQPAQKPGSSDASSGGAGGLLSKLFGSPKKK